MDQWWFNIRGSDFTSFCDAPASTCTGARSPSTSAHAAAAPSGCWPRLRAHERVHRPPPLRCVRVVAAAHRAAVSAVLVLYMARRRLRALRAAARRRSSSLTTCESAPAGWERTQACLQARETAKRHSSVVGRGKGCHKTMFGNSRSPVAGWFGSSPARAPCRGPWDGSRRRCSIIGPGSFRSGWSREARQRLADGCFGLT